MKIFINQPHYLLLIVDILLKVLSNLNVSILHFYQIHDLKLNYFLILFYVHHNTKTIILFCDYKNFK